MVKSPCFTMQIVLVDAQGPVQRQGLRLTTGGTVGHHLRGIRRLHGGAAPPPEGTDGPTRAPPRNSDPEICQGQPRHLPKAQ